MTIPSSPVSDTSQGHNEKEIRVMLVDDSAVIRGALSRVLKASPHINVVKSVENGSEAVEAAKNVQPHVIILDIEMPVMDGITALPKILEVSPKSKVIMFSTLTEKGASVTLKAMSLGAVECLVKPSSATDVGPGSDFQKYLTSLIENLVPAWKRSARGISASAAANGATTAIVRDAPIPSAAPVAAPSFTLKVDPVSYKGVPAILAIGSSTGGPQALFNVLKHCTNFRVPIIITQHMPATFTKILAQHITQQTGIEAFEGADGMVVEAGKAYVAPGGFHMTFERDGTQLVIKLDQGPAVNFCKPAVDVMLDSIIDIYGQKVLTAILTGMGHDGLGGAERLVAEHGRVVAQDEKTSVVWGMPGAVATAGLCADVLPLDEIGPWLKKAVMG